MKPETRHKLFTAWAYADHEDKSTEWMFAYMSDYADVDYDEAVDFVCETYEEERDEWYKENPNWLEEMFSVNESRLNSL